MIQVVATNILSPLGSTTAQNWAAVLDGRSALCRHEGCWHLPDAFVASLLGSVPADGGLTRFESLAVASVCQALREAPEDIRVADTRTQFFLSTTKGNIGHLDQDLRVALPDAARAIAEALGIVTGPLVVSNACISGVAALVAAMRALEAGQCDTAIVVGCDVLTEFVVSGFQSFKALSPEACRPFDEARTGLNLGEAAATILLRRVSPGEVSPDGWYLLGGSIHNDANHISGPSRVGEGSYLALRDVMHGFDAGLLAFVNAHGTATPYNDEMESIAIARAGLSDVPLCGLKGYYGHTLGAAGVLETALSMAAVDRGVVPGTRGFVRRGVSRPVDVCADHRTTSRRAFVKLLSGFGGCNGAVLLAKGDVACRQPVRPRREAALRMAAQLHLQSDATGRQQLVDLYRRHSGQYPKFFKMDVLCRLGFVATESLLSSLPCDAYGADGQLIPREDVAVIFFSRCGSLVNDRHYQDTLRPGNYFPSPAIFVYTLPNIVTGEVCIRHRWRGESAMYLLPHCDWQRIEAIALAAARGTAVRHIVCGWLDAADDDTFEARLAAFDVDAPDSE